MWQGQKEKSPTNHASIWVHSDLHFADGTIAVHTRVKARTWGLVRYISKMDQIVIISTANSDLAGA